MNSEQESIRKSGRTVVKANLTIYVQTLDDDEALIRVDEWMRCLQSGDFDRVKAMRESIIFPSSWQPALPSDKVQTRDE